MAPRQGWWRHSSLPPLTKDENKILFSSPEPLGPCADSNKSSLRSFGVVSQHPQATTHRNVAVIFALYALFPTEPCYAGSDLIASLRDLFWKLGALQEKRARRIQLSCELDRQRQRGIRAVQAEPFRWKLGPGLHSLLTGTQ